MYQILVEEFEEQDKLITDGKMQKPEIIYGFSPEGLEIIKRGRTAEMVFADLDKKLGMK